MKPDPNVRYAPCFSGRVLVPYIAKRLSDEGDSERETEVSFDLKRIIVNGVIPDSVSRLDPDSEKYREFAHFRVTAGIGDSRTRYQSQRKRISEQAYGLVQQLMWDHLININRNGHRAQAGNYRRGSSVQHARPGSEAGQRYRRA